jgi:hypothetical protein
VSARAWSLGLLWFAVFGGVAAWTAHLLVSYLIVSVGCPAARSGDALVLALVATTVATALVAIAAAVAALSVTRRAERWQGFLGAFGLLLNGLGLGTIVFGGVLPAFLAACA